MRHLSRLLVLTLCACTGADADVSTPPAPAPGKQAPDSTARQEPVRHTLSFKGASLDLMLGWYSGLHGPIEADPRLADARLTLVTLDPVDDDELRWLFETHLQACGMHLQGQRVVPAEGGAAPVAGFVGRARSGDATEVARLAERTWRGRLSVHHRGDLLLLSGPDAKAAMARLHENDHLAHDPLGP